MTKQFDLAEFEAFCRSKGDGEYDYCDPIECAAAQFVRDGMGMDKVNAVPNFVYTSRGTIKIPIEAEIAIEDPRGLGGNGDWRFSALASRLSKLREG
jgi:hypothetical protein